MISLEPPQSLLVPAMNNNQQSSPAANLDVLPALPPASMLLSLRDELYSGLRRLIAFVVAQTLEFFQPSRYITYKEVPLSDVCALQLERVPRKTLVLDLDETLLHSCYMDPETNEYVGGSQVPADAVPDHKLLLLIDGTEPILFLVYKRPHVDLFLDHVSKWYDLAIYTASVEAYATRVVDLLDAGRGILPRRFFRQHCSSHASIVSKDLTLVNRDMRRTLIIDNTPNAYKDFPHNAIPIKSYIYDPSDTELLKLLPFLDALRFTKDVRTVLRHRVD
ncbi:CTD nuclear envelope phosphatase 1 homolog [Drosophila guanche]|uniref:Blast:Sodium/potassium/calcium exchanger 6, mitochondrial n=1 Tax=Drosophila guanche TaxID=7266 RepID=A0A3B0J0R0_DROGU|nr:CTD nuclear envelope phosphatase 1 homolog [Drosophila guanche]SPP74315.1 blast:Sodium/potassium/calcium exchanger 6%2C mitochondrial [Drosophila guanche]